MSAKACVIFNPHSGRGKRQGEAPLDRALLERMNIDIIELKKAKDIPATVDRAVAKGYDPIIAAGGDGTICGIAEALSGKGTRLALLPMGTFNYFARSLGIPEEQEAALEVATGGADMPLSVGEINGRIFLNNASIGAYAAVLEVREKVYREWGRSRIAAYWSVIKAMAVLYRSLKMKITVDGKVRKIRSPVAFVAIRAYQLREFELAGVEEIQNGEMAVLVARSSGRLMLLWRAIRIFFRRARVNHDYELLTGREIDIETRRRNRRVARDGEREKMGGPYRFRLRQGALTVKVPNDAQKAA